MPKYNSHAPQVGQPRRLRTLPIQLKYVMYLTLTAGFTSLVMIFVMAWFIQRNYNLFMGDELGISAQVIQIVRHEQRILETWLFILFIGSVLIMFLATFLTVKKLTTPIAALKRQLALYSRGDWSHKLRLGDQDEFKELEALVNKIRYDVLELKNKLEQQTSE
ncbi:MAG: cell wall metabolism sensor histidine kinase WalK [Deltaproteobacteria bacterium]|nr:cell wall metabolism sensor histidine kinase WalK [Deltaproteobacteria bacterium]